MNAIYLEASKVPQQLRGGYSGKQFKVVVTETVTVPADAGLWSGGSRDTYRLVHLETGEAVAASDDMSSPWDNGRVERTITLRPGFAVVEHSLFCGKDMGLTFHVHPDNAAKLLPAPAAELTAHEAIVLDATCSYKSSYGGRDRYDMARDAVRWARKPVDFPSREQWDAAKAALIGKGLLNKAGAATVAGRNARVKTRGS